MYVSIRFESYRLVLIVVLCLVFAFAFRGTHGNEQKKQVKRLDGLVRTLALYGILERNVMDSSK